MDLEWLAAINPGVCSNQMISSLMATCDLTMSPVGGGGGISPLLINKEKKQQES